MKPLVIIPTYNEAESILKVIEGLLENPYHLINVLVVDDGSPDGTADIVANKKSSRVHLIRREAKSGLGSAYRAGFEWALTYPEYTHIVTMDGDSSHLPSDLNRMLARSSVYDLVIGSRWIQGGEAANTGHYLGECFHARGALILELHLDCPSAILLADLEFTRENSLRHLILRIFPLKAIVSKLRHC